MPARRRSCEIVLTHGLPDSGCPLRRNKIKKKLKEGEVNFIEPAFLSPFLSILSLAKNRASTAIGPLAATGHELFTVAS